MNQQPKVYQRVKNIGSVYNIKSPGPRFEQKIIVIVLDNINVNQNNSFMQTKLKKTYTRYFFTLLYWKIYLSND